MVTLPPLAALRALEATVRLGGLARAAVELNLTTSASSHQLRGWKKVLARVCWNAPPALAASESYPPARDYCLPPRKVGTWLSRPMPRSARRSRSAARCSAPLPSECKSAENRHQLMGRLRDPQLPPSPLPCKARRRCAGVDAGCQSKRHGGKYRRAPDAV